MTKDLRLRLPDELHQMLVEAAAEESPARSLNSEILNRLYRSFIAPAAARGVASERDSEVHVDLSGDMRARIERLEATAPQALAEFQATMRSTERTLAQMLSWLENQNPPAKR